MWVVRERITFGGGWGHPLKWQRETGKGEARQRAKKDARRTRNFLDQWEGREKIVGKSKQGERDDWLGVKSEGRMTGEEKGRMTLGSSREAGQVVRADRMMADANRRLLSKDLMTALVEITGRGHTLKAKTLAAHTVAYPRSLQQRILSVPGSSGHQSNNKHQCRPPITVAPLYRPLR